MARDNDAFDLDDDRPSRKQLSPATTEDGAKTSIAQRFKKDPFFELRQSPYAKMLGLSKPNPWTRPLQDNDEEDADDLDDDYYDYEEDEDDENLDPTQDEEGSLQDGPDGHEEQDPAVDEDGSAGDDRAEDLDKEDKKKKGQKDKQGNDKKGNDKKGGDKQGGGKGAALPGKLKDPWDPEVTMEIAKVAGGIPPIPMPIPCPECKKMSLYLDKWVNNGMRLTILLSYIVGALVITKSCPVQMKDAIQQIHFLCLNSKCKKFAFNSFKYKFVPEMTSGKMESRQWVFASPFPKMSVKDAEKIRRKVSNKNKSK